MFVIVKETAKRNENVHYYRRAMLLKFCQPALLRPKEALWSNKRAMLLPKEEWIQWSEGLTRVHSGESRCAADLWFTKSLAQWVESRSISVSVRLHLGLRWALLPGHRCLLHQFSPCDPTLWQLRLQEMDGLGNQRAEPADKVGPVSRGFSRLYTMLRGLRDLWQEAGVGTGIQGREWGSWAVMPFDIVQILLEGRWPADWWKWL